MQEKYNVTGMTCAACQARVQKSVSNLTGVQECNVNLLKNSMVVTYDDKNVNSGQIIAAVEKAGYGASLQQAKGRSAAQAVSPVETAKKEYEAMRRRVIWSFVFTIPLFYISMGHMLCWPLPGVFLGTENSMVYALTLFLLLLPVAIINNKYYRMGFKTLFHGSPNMDSLIALGSGASMAYGIYALYKIAWGFGHGNLALVDAQLFKALFFHQFQQGILDCILRISDTAIFPSGTHFRHLLTPHLLSHKTIHAVKESTDLSFLSSHCTVFTILFSMVQF